MKLHYLMVRLVCYPSIDATEKAMSYRKLFKKRVKRFKTGKWEEIWQEQKKVKVGIERVRGKTLRSLPTAAESAAAHAPRSNAIGPSSATIA